MFLMTIYLFGNTMMSGEQMLRDIMIQLTDNKFT